MNNPSCIKANCTCVGEYWSEEKLTVKCPDLCAKRICCFTCDELLTCILFEKEGCHVHPKINNLLLFLYQAGKIPVKFRNGEVWYRNGKGVRKLNQGDLK
jgi:hypothetical protein